MKKILNITNEPNQLHTILFEESEITLHLRFHEICGFWTFDATFKDKSVYGIKLSLSTLHIESSNLPFDFVCIDNSDYGLDPFEIDAFLNRCSLFLLEAEDMENVRGLPVEV